MKKKYRPYTKSIISWIVLGVVAYIALEYAVDFALVIDLAIALNIATFIMFGLDKSSAANKWERVPEKVFYLMVLLGGAIGALAGMYLFRHKTRKTSFQLVVALLILLQVVIIALIV